MFLLFYIKSVINQTYSEYKCKSMYIIHLLQ